MPQAGAYALFDLRRPVQAIEVIEIETVGILGVVSATQTAGTRVQQNVRGGGIIHHVGVHCLQHPVRILTLDHQVDPQDLTQRVEGRGGRRHIGKPLAFLKIKKHNSKRYDI